MTPNNLVPPNRAKPKRVRSAVLLALVALLLLPIAVAYAKSGARQSTRTAPAKRVKENKKVAQARKRAEARRVAEARKRVEIRRVAEAKKRAEARRATEAKKRAEARRVAEARKRAEARKVAVAKKRAEAREVAEAASKKREQAHKTKAVAKSKSKVARGADASNVGPSGEAMPTGNPAGWKEVFSDDFNGTSLNLSRWRPYTGVPGVDPNGMWNPSHIVVQNGELILKGYEDNGQYETAGLSSQPGLVQTYGKYLVRYRVDQGDGVSHALMLWPADDVWGPEIDFSEDNGTNRQTTTATLHWGTGTPSEETRESHTVDLTQWHTLGVEWTPGKVVYTLDGQPWGSLNTSNVPNIPMVLDMQTQVWCAEGQPSPTVWEHCMDETTPAEVDMDVDWVVAYAPAG